MANARECAPYISQAFGQHPFSYWMEKLRTMKGQWAAYQNSLEVAQDQQVLANDMIYQVESADGGPPIKLVANPVQFDHQAVSNVRGPEANEHTELFLMELGLDWDRLAELKSKGAIA
jgi:crotonobetainyl-CoA:carnitine CoA-transferase CaiB-like acyl-CoA transferase